MWGGYVGARPSSERVSLNGYGCDKAVAGLLCHGAVTYLADLPGHNYPDRYP